MGYGGLECMECQALIISFRKRIRYLPVDIYLYHIKYIRSLWVYLSFRIQYIASQVTLPEDIIYVNTMVFGSYWVSRDDLFTTKWEAKKFLTTRHQPCDLWL